MKNNVILSLIALSLCTFSFSSAAWSQSSPDTSFDNVIFLVSQSGYMSKEHKLTKTKKITMAIDIMEKINKAIPDVPIDGGIYTFIPGKEVLSIRPYNKVDFSKAIATINTNISYMGHREPVGEGLLSLKPVIHELSGNTAIILLTDHFSNWEEDPVNQAKFLVSTARGNVCFYVISFADNPTGLKTLGDIARLTNCAMIIPANRLMDTDKIDLFVKEIFSGPSN